ADVGFLRLLGKYFADGEILLLESVGGVDKPHYPEVDQYVVGADGSVDSEQFDDPRKLMATPIP
ncbi:hypothetical protein, partial [Haloarcula laminariae]|uniref:hypothetical protein n=1 Tax=Haloarcula laminariae TaxID=2961577 RepID=UPI00240765C8